MNVATPPALQPLLAMDAVGQSVVVALLGMSLVSWFVIFLKGWSVWRLRQRTRTALAGFWAAGSLDQALVWLQRGDRSRLIQPLVYAATQAQRAGPDQGLAGSADRSEQLTRVLRQALSDATLRLESGLTVLASIGSTAPFVGLFGTVWGIYHAMNALSGGGALTIDQVAAPVGEALIMTAVGLAVAIPAVLAYNALTRVNRVVQADLDGFAYDLRALLSPSA